MTYEISLSLGYYWLGTSQFLVDRKQFRISCLIFIHFNRINWISVSHSTAMVLVQKSDGVFSNRRVFILFLHETYYELPNDVWP